MGQEMEKNMSGPLRTEGAGLRWLREERGLSLKQVEKRSQQISRDMRNPRFYISAGRLWQVESNGSVLSIFKMASLSHILRVPLTELFHIYGLE